MRFQLISTYKLILIFVCLSVLICSCSQFSTPTGARLAVSSAITGSTYSNGKWHTNRTYYIKKQNEQPQKLNGRNLVAAVNDNPSALSHAKVYKVMRTATIPLFLTLFAGTTYGILGREKNPTLARGFLTAGLISLPALIITASIGSRQAKKAIRKYNEF